MHAQGARDVPFSFASGDRRAAVFSLMGTHRGNPEPGEVRVPITEVLSGLSIHPLEPGETPLEAFVLIKCLDAEGDPAWSYRTTNRLNREELLGALIVQVDVLRHELRSEWDDSD